MRNAFLLCLCLVSLLAPAQTGPADSTIAPLNLELDRRYGFLGNKFDTPLSAFKGLVFVENFKGEQVYKKVPDIKAYGGVAIESIHYKFYKGLLSGVQVFAPNSIQSNHAWRTLLKAAYGAARDSSLFISEYSSGGNYLWTGHNAGINFSSYQGRKISIYVYSMNAVRRKERDEAAKLKRAAQGL